MNSCGCGQHVITDAPAVRGVDVGAILLCDVLTDGTVAGVALVEPLYDTVTGDRVGTRTVDPTTGTAYLPRGTLRPCEPGTNTTSTQMLCDIAEDGTVTTFLRATTYDSGGELLATFDRTPDGAAYSPTGAVGTCPSPCRSSNTEILCDSAPVPLDLSATYLPFSEAPVDVPSANEFDAGPTVGQQLWDGQSVTFGPTGGRHDLTYAAGTAVVACTDCGEPDDMVRIQARVTATLNGPTAGQGSTGGLELLNGNRSLAVSPFPPSTRVGWTGPRTVSATVPLSDVRAGRIRIRLGAETAQSGPKSWTFTGFTLTGELEATGCGQRFLRTYLRDCITGGTTDIVDTALDGTPYVPVGEVAVCAERLPCDERPSPCQNCETVQLCDTRAVTSAIGPIPPMPQGGSTLPNGVIWSSTGGDTVLFSTRRYRADAQPAVYTFSEPVTLQWQALGLVGGRATSLTMPLGTQVVSIHANHVYDRTTRVLTAGPGARDTDASTFRMTNVTVWTAPVGTVGGSFPQYGMLDVTVDVARPFLRTVCRDCSGGVVDATDTDLDAVTPYTPTGAVGQCRDSREDRQRYDVEPLLLCDAGPDGTVTPFLRHLVYSDFSGALADTRDTTLDGNTRYVPSEGGTVGECCEPTYETICVTPLVPRSTRVVSNPGNDTSGGVDPAWTWGPTPVGGRPVHDVAPHPAWTTPLPPGGGWVGINADRSTAGLPDGASDYYMVASFTLPPNAVLDATSLKIDTLNADDAVVGYSLNGGPETPTPTQNTRFVDPPYSEPDHPITGAVAGRNTLAIRVHEFGAPTVAGALLDVTLTYRVPGTPEYWTVEHGCDGTATYIASDGTRYPGALPTTAIPCAATQDCCQPVQVCITDTVTETIEFISNEAQVYDNSIDTVWTWTTDGDADGPAAGATWYQTYRARFAPNPAAWSVTDSAPVRKAGWISPHPDGLTRSTGASGEGPTLSGSPANPMRWWARASFSLPAAADPDSIRVQITVLNADQVANRFRLNDGAWITLPPTASHNGTAYTFGPATIPGARPGTNTLYFEAQETVVDNPFNGAGVMAHFIITYDVPGLGKRSWTRMVCCDDSVYYLDEDGGRQDALPPSSSLVTCDSGADPLVLCDDNGTFLRHLSYVGDQIITMDTDLNGSPYTPIGQIRSCGADR